MIDLTIDVEAKKDLLAHFVSDKLQVLGYVKNVGNVDLRKVLFKDQDVPDKDAILKALRDNLAQAQTDCLTWENDVQPLLVAVPQAVINYGTLFANALPNIRSLIKEDITSNRASLKNIFSGLSNSIKEQIGSLNKIKGSLTSIAGSIKNDSDNFSEKNNNFSRLESIDEENLRQAQTALKNLSDMLDKYNKDITDKIILEEEYLDIADIVIAAGGVIGKAVEPAEALGLAIGLFFIVSAGMTMQDIIGDINSAFQTAMQEAKYKVEITELNEQLLCLKVTSSTLQETLSAMQDIQTTLQSIIDGWSAIGSTIDGAQTALDDSSQALDQIINEFNLGRASAEWEEAVNFAQKMEIIGISFGKQKLTTPPPGSN